MAKGLTREQAKGALARCSSHELRVLANCDAHTASLLLEGKAVDPRARIADDLPIGLSLGRRR